MSAPTLSELHESACELLGEQFDDAATADRARVNIARALNRGAADGVRLKCAMTRIARLESELATHTEGKS